MDRKDGSPILKTTIYRKDSHTSSSIPKKSRALSPFDLKRVKEALSSDDHERGIKSSQLQANDTKRQELKGGGGAQMKSSANVQKKTIDSEALWHWYTVRKKFKESFGPFYVMDYQGEKSSSQRSTPVER